MFLAITVSVANLGLQASHNTNIMVPMSVLIARKSQ